MVHYHARTATTGLNVRVRISVGVLRSTAALRPDVQRDHPLFADGWRKQVLLAQEVQREVDQDAADGAQLLGGLLRVAVGQSRRADVLQQLSQVMDRVRRKAPENLRGENGGKDLRHDA